MLSLNSPRWSELQCAYGLASDIPPLLDQLSGLTTSENNNEPWFTLWSALAHQGDVNSASFAAVPHVVHALASAPDKAEFTYFQFPAWVEVCRKKTGIEIPDDLQTVYFAALSQLPSLVAAAAAREWEPEFLPCALSSIAAAKGQTAVAEAMLELTPEVAEEFMEWFFKR